MGTPDIHLSSFMHDKATVRLLQSQHPVMYSLSKRYTNFVSAGPP